jgi:flagellar biosynthetic protein FlhB
MRQLLTFNAASLKQTGNMLLRLSDATTIGLAGCATFAAMVSTATIFAAVASGGWVNSLKPIMPDFSRINPLSGFGNLFTKKKLFSVAKMMVVTIILFAIAASFLSSGMQSISLMGLLLLVILGAAMVDFPLQKFLHKDQMKMSHQEVKQEGKESDGNPEIKAKMRQRQREMAQKNSVNSVPKADFVVMNPTHFAVAIRYDEKTMGAPQVISKGADLLAMKIRDVAKHHSIPVLQAPMLARALYANSELDQDIPSSLYTAVAQVLAYVYRLRAAMRGDGPMPGDLPQPFVPPDLDPLAKTSKAVAA